MSDFDSLKYDPSLDHNWEDVPDISDSDVWVKSGDPITEGQLGFIRTLLDSTAVNALTEGELRDINTIELPLMTAGEAAALIDKILEAQPPEPNLRRQGDINKYLLRFTKP